MSTSSALGDRLGLNASRSSSILSDSSFRPRVSGKSRALARALLGSSRASVNSATSESKAPLINETTLVTDEATLGAHEMWDSASFTSIDTVDDLSSFASQRTTPRQKMRSTQEILTLVRQIKQAAAPLDLSRRERREPDPEVNWATPKQKYAVSASRSTPPSVEKSSAKGSAPKFVATASATPGTSVLTIYFAECSHIHTCSS